MPVSGWIFLAAWWPLALAAIAVWTVLYVHMRLDGFRGGWHFPAVATQLTLAVALLVTLMFAFLFLRREYFSRLIVLYFGGFSLVGFIAVRYSIRGLFHSRTRSGGTRKVVILGNGKVAHELARKIEHHPELMLQVVGFLHPGGPHAGLQSDSRPAAEAKSVTSLGVVDLFRGWQVEELIIALPDVSASETKKLIALCRREGFRVSLIPQWYELYVSRTRLMEVDGLPVISLENHTPSAVTFVIKRAMDMLLGSILLVLVSPLIFLIAAALLVQRGKMFQSEVRCGKGGDPFAMYRFNVDRDRLQTLAGFERLLVKLSLTELPQLWNVLLGDMALVGPRPESPDRVRHYSDWQRQRLSVTPGLTGLAQVYGLREQHSSEEKARFDLQYIYHWSPLLDLSLMLQTAWTLAVRLWRPHQLAVQPSESVVEPAAAPIAEAVHADSTHSGAD
ncbi:MAG: sugar transferase [Terriglobales bacterium]